MEYRITWGGHPEDVCFATTGRCSPLVIDAMTREALADPRWRDGLNVLIDHTQSDWSAMTTDELTEFARLLRELAPEFGQQRVAAVFGGAESFRSGRLVGRMLDREVPWLGHAFASVAEARQWLCEPSAQILPDILPQW
jgi:hypothetical protein